jgi:hypothetical protein
MHASILFSLVKFLGASSVAVSGLAMFFGFKSPFPAYEGLPVATTEFHHDRWDMEQL